ncbi:MAG TPA: PQQ-binding-like beta-propeller repeat protein, partial [Acidimicrobiia bacterium]|nr:PQQ-binding-like beta-propeller repeat protein [Acidimicrobiia bacterium]
SRWPPKSSPEPQGGRAITTTPDGTTVLVASAHSDLAYDAGTGRLLWQEPNGAPGVLGGQDIAVSPSGALVVSTGEATHPHPERVVSGEIVVTAREPTSGRPLWQSRYRDPDGGPYTARALAVTDRGVFVAADGLIPRRLAVAAFDSDTGARRWLRHDRAGRDVPAGPTRAVSVAATPDGRRVYVSGFRVVDPPYVEWATLAYDGVTGALLWEARYPGGGHFAAEPKDIRLHPDGHLLYVTGWSKQPGLSGESFDFVTVAYDTATGRAAWTGGYRSTAAGFPLDSDDLGWSVDLSPDGRRLFIAGYSEDPRPDTDAHGYQVEARDALTGAPQWSAAVPSFGATSDHEGLFGDVIVRSSPDGRQVYLAMAAHDALSARRYDVPGSTYHDIVLAVAGFDSDSGRFLWRGTHPAPSLAATYTRGLAVDPTGHRIYVTGITPGPGAATTETAAFVVGAG